jgi:hypothetical protein
LVSCPFRIIEPPIIPPIISADNALSFTISLILNSRVLFMPSFCPVRLRPATQDEQNTAR